jgi:hypothetical protein
MILLQILFVCVLWVLLLSIPGSIVYGIASYLIYKFGRGILVDDEDWLGFKAALLAIYQAERRVELQEKEHEALFNYKKYKDIIQSAVEEKRNPGLHVAIKRRFAKIRSWWSISFYLFYGMIALTSACWLYVEGLHGSPERFVLWITVGLNIISAISVYHCAFRKEGTRLLLVVLCFFLFYTPVVLAIVAQVLQSQSLQGMGSAHMWIEVVLPSLLLFSIVAYYWIMGLLLFRANREMARLRKLKRVKLLLQM